MFYGKPLLFFFFCLTLFNGVSQGSHDRYIIRKAEIKGLPATNLLTSLAQDSIGFLWIGSMNGLYRYDGHRSFAYINRKNDTTSLAHNFVQTMARKGDQLLIGTFGASINSLNLKEDRVTRSDKSTLGSNSLVISKIIWSHDDHSFWVASPGAIFKLSEQGKILLRFELPAIIHPENRIRDLLPEQEHLYIATGEELVLMDKRTQEITRPVLSANPSIKPQYSLLRTLVKFEDRIIAGGDSGILVVDPKTLQPDVHKTADLKGMGKVTKLMVDQKGRLWIAGGGNIYLLDSFGHAPKMVAGGVNGVTDMLQDVQQTIWITTEKDGLYSLIKPAMAFREVPGLLSTTKGTTVNSIVEETKDTWLISHNAGLARYNIRSGKLEEINTGAPKEQGPILGLFIDSKRRTWICSQKNGIRVSADGRPYRKVFSISNTVKGEAPGFMFFFYEDEHGVWGGFYSNFYQQPAFFLYDEQADVFKQRPVDFADTSFLNPAALSQVIVDGGHWWVGTWNGGLFRVDHKKDPLRVEQNLNIRSPSRRRLSLDIVSCVIKSRENKIWAGTIGGGLNVYDPQKDTAYSFTITDGLPSNLIYRIEEDRKGVLWISTDNGLSAFDPATSRFTNYHRSSGLDHTNFNFIASMRAQDGTLAFGTNNGHAVFFNPGDADSSGNTQKPLITDIRLANRPLSSVYTLPKAVYLQDTLKLAYRESSVITIDLSNMDLADPSAYAFEYSLSGFDKGWTRITDRNTLTYTNLDPGKYELMIRSADHLGRWSLQTKRLTIIISPPFWKTPWFYLLVAAGILSIFYLFFKMRLEQQLRVHRIRNKLHRDLHDDVGATLSSIKAYSEILKSSPDNPVIADLIKNNSEEMIDRLEVISWAMKPEYDNFKSLQQRMQQVAMPICRAKGIEFSFQVKGMSDDEMIPAEFRQNIFLVFKEALNNAVKYSNASKVTVTHERTDHKYIMSIEDDGIGFKREESSSGNGMKNMKSRADDLRADLQIITEPGSGTTIRLIMRYPLQIPRNWGVRPA